MNRSLTLSAAAVLLATTASAQCFSATGTSIVPMMAPTSIYTVDDEGRSSDIPFGFPFVLGGTTWTHFTVESNGEIYLTDGTGPVGATLFGLTSLNAVRGVAGDSPRICAFGSDLQAATSSTWDVLVDSSVSGEVKVSWVGMRHYLGNEDFSMSVTMRAGGLVEFNYAGNFGTPGFADFAAVSAGNAVGSSTTPASDLDMNADSGSIELLYESTWAGGFDLNGKSILILTNGNGGLSSQTICGTAQHNDVGEGCVGVGRESFYQHFTDAGVAATTLTGNVINMARNADGYTASWIPGIASALYVAPTANATNLPVLNDGEFTYTSAAGFPIPGGTVNSLTVTGNGVVAFGPGPAEPVNENWVPDPVTMLAGSHGGVYFWHAYNEEENGDVWAEELNGVLYITFQDVENFPLGVANPSTWQLQIDQNTGDMYMVFVTIDSDNSPIFGFWPQDHLIGFTPPGVSVDPGPVDLATGLPVTTQPDIEALALGASPVPISTPLGGSTVTYTVDNMRELTPGSGVVAGVVAFSLTPSSLDLTPLGAPGCFAYVGTLDVTLPVIGALGQPQSAQLVLPPGLPNGTLLYAQAACLAGGVNAFGLVTSNGIESTIGEN